MSAFCPALCLRGEDPDRMAMGAAARGIGLAITMAIGTVSAHLGAADPDIHPTKARIAHDTREVEESDFDTLSAEPYRAHFGRTDLYIPTFFRAENGKYDLIVHFHGLSAAQESNVERSRVNAIVATVNVGVGSGPYENVFKEKWTFPNLLKLIDKQVKKSGRARGARLGRLALSAWSAGYGSVSAILRVPSNAKRVDAVMLADGLHTDFVRHSHTKVDDGPLQKYAAIAEQAKRGEKMFALTHSSITIPRKEYASTTETIGELLKLVDVAKEPTVADGPRGMSETYESHAGDFHVKGFEGTGVKNHIDHIWAMNETMLPYLRARWSAAAE
jgi:hypothetical protein